MDTYYTELIILYGLHKGLSWVWSRLKRLTNDFCGTSGHFLDKLVEKGLNVDEYVNGIICTGLFFMECEHNKLGINGKKYLLIEYLKIN